MLVEEIKVEIAKIRAARCRKKKTKKKASISKKDMLAKASKAFSEGKITMEQYREILENPKSAHLELL